jgi:hypothetical protein
MWETDGQECSKISPGFCLREMIGEESLEKA